MYFTLVLSTSAFSTGAYSAYHLTLVTPPARIQLAVANITQCKPTACALGQLPAQATVAFFEPWCAGLRGQHATEGRFTGRSALDEYWRA
ncbi:hypothetical protein PF008_g14469 [Phytophthora fragariae]|uniref:Uncharacterized protein n=1 Tax=Phytophthora fragariae TaxID=53985 RepID=A0A6G0RIB4_9STRA|nr:hypothetical protein PF008_g14469 [Phytophthora fragariae]